MTEKPLRFVLYQIYDSAGALLYVGSTTDPGGRLHNHHLQQPWWDEAANITLEHFDTAAEMRAAEQSAIEIFGPRYNIVHTNKPYPWLDKPRRRKGTGSIFQRADGYWIARIELTTRGGGTRQNKQVCVRTREEAEQKLTELLALKQELAQQ